NRKFRDSLVQSDEQFSTTWIIDEYPAVSNGQYREFSYRLTILDTLTGVVNGTNDTFTFTQTPAIIYRNGVEETDLGTFDGNDFTFDTPPIVTDIVTGRLVIPIKSFTHDAPDNDFVDTLSCELARIPDRTLLTRDTPIRFETAEKIS